MSLNRFFESMKRGEVSRRDFTRAAASVGLASVTIPTMARQAHAADLTVFTWSGYELPEFMVPFTDKYGSEPNFSFYADNDDENNNNKQQHNFKNTTAHHRK